MQKISMCESAHTWARFTYDYDMSQRHPIVNGHNMFVTTNVRNSEKLFLHEPFAREAIEVLYRIQEQYPFILYGFVIMPDHMHLLLHVPEPQSISKIMDRYKMGVSHSIGVGPLWQRRFYMKIPDNSYKVLQYIHDNPVKAGIVEKPEDYPWSSAGGKWDITDLPDDW